MIMEKQFKDKTLEELGCSLEELKELPEFKKLVVELICIYNNEHKHKAHNNKDNTKYIKQNDLAKFINSSQSNVSNLSKGNTYLFFIKDTVLFYAYQKAINHLEIYEYF